MEKPDLSVRWRQAGHVIRGPAVCCGSPEGHNKVTMGTLLQGHKDARGGSLEEVVFLLNSREVLACGFQRHRGEAFYLGWRNGMSEVQKVISVASPEALCSVVSSRKETMAL